MEKADKEESRVWRDVATSQGAPRIATQSQKREEGGGVSPRAFRGSATLPTLGLGLPASREYISVVLRTPPPQSVVIWNSSPRTLTQHPGLARAPGGGDTWNVLRI